MRLLLFLTLLFSAIARAGDMGEPLDTGSIPADLRPRNLDQVSVEQRLGTEVPAGLTFRDEQGHAVRFGELLGAGPVVLTLSYFRCPGLCSLVMNAVADAIRQLPGRGLVPGRDFQVLTVSIDPTEGPRLALAKQRTYLARLGREKESGASAPWRMLTGTERDIRALAGAVGFRYAYDPASKQYSHAAVAMVLTPAGRVSRYLFGIRFSADELAGALRSAGVDRISAPVRAFLLYCFHYDPANGTWTLRILNTLRLLGAFTLLGLGGLFLALRKGAAA